MFALIADVAGQVQALEEFHQLRRRRRRGADQQVFLATIAAVISDVVHRELTEPGAWVAIPLSKQKLGGTHRARARALNSTLPQILARLAMPEMDFVEMQKGYRSPFGEGRQTVIRRGRRLLTRMADHGITQADLKCDPKVLPDPLVVRAKKVAGAKGKRCDVPKTETAARYRAEMDQINTAIAAVSLSSPFGTDQRFLRRIFNNGSIDQGGRLYGGFWQGLSKEQRLWGVRIDDEPIVALDFGQMAVRIAYSFVGATPPTDDLYRVPRFEFHRKGIKAVLNAMLSSDQVPMRFPMGTRSLFHRSTKVGDVVQAIRRRHPALDPLFATAACHRTFNVESNILVGVLLRLIDAGVTALPIHDCLLVARSRKGITRKTMLDVFQEHTGIEGVVEEEGESDGDKKPCGHTSHPSEPSTQPAAGRVYVDDSH